MVTLDNITFRYTRGGVKALDTVSGTISPGIHLLMGENGAGKTTLLRVMGGVSHPASGCCLLDGTDTMSRLPSERRRIFFLPDAMEIPARSINGFASVHSAYYPGFSPEMFAANLAEFGLTGDEPSDGMSLGMLHKSWLAYVLALNVELLLLDEPANGLDINSRKILRAMMARCVDETQTVVISTHTVSDLHALYDGVMMVSGGRMTLCLPTWQVAERIGFISGPIPAEGAIFTEQDSGRFISIISDPKAGSGDVDFALLYSALLSPSRDRVLELLDTETN